jgi:hypothetical protein
MKTNLLFRGEALWFYYWPVMIYLWQVFDYINKNSNVVIEKMKGEKIVPTRYQARSKGALMFLELKLHQKCMERGLYNKCFYSFQEFEFIRHESKRSLRPSAKKLNDKT